MKKLVGFFLVALVGGISAIAVYDHFFEKEAQTFAEKQQTYFTNDQRALDAPTVDFVGVAEKSTPAVVHIKVTMQQRQAQGQEFFDPFGMFDERFYGQRPQQQGSGSGVIISDDGYIATNHHVIQNAAKIEVVLDDKRTYVAELVGEDPETDLGLIKINEEDLPFLSFGNSDNIRVGEWVVAVGNPFNLNSTVTAGIVSAKGRNINLLRQNSEYAIENFIQTDAAINPGNSGGALVNTKGELVGINTAIASRTGSFAGYGFAVPVNIVRKVMDDILKYGEVKRAILGVRIQDLTQELADEKGLKDLNGVFVPEVIEKSAAAKGGMKDEDVILAINGVGVNKSSELQEQISRYHPGDEVEITVKRGADKKTIKVTLQNRDGKEEMVTDIKRDDKTILGAEVENMSRQERMEAKVMNGVRVKSVNKGPLKNKNIPAGFIITHIDKRKIHTTQDIERALENKTGGILIEGVTPDGDKEAFAVVLEDKD